MLDGAALTTTSGVANVLASLDRMSVPPRYVVARATLEARRAR